MIKKCFKCGEEKHISEFYKHPRMADGHLNKCKVCTRKDVKTRAERPDMVEKIREEKRLWALTERGKKTMSAYASGLGREKCSEAKSRYEKRNPKKRKIHYMVNNAVRDGKLSKPDRCQKCGKTGCRIEAHHKDYDKPFEVDWLCRSCHAEWHRFNEAINGD